MELRGDLRPYVEVAREASMEEGKGFVSLINYCLQEGGEECAGEGWWEDSHEGGEDQGFVGDEKIVVEVENIKATLVVRMGSKP